MNCAADWFYTLFALAFLMLFALRLIRAAVPVAAWLFGRASYIISLVLISDETAARPDT